MNSTVREYRGNARDRGIIAPAQARIVGLRSIGMMSMGKLSHHDADPTEIAARNHRARMANQRVTGISIIYRADSVVAARHLDDFLGLSHGVGQRFFTEHVEPGREECSRDLEMRAVGRCD